LLGRALTALPTPALAGRIRLRADAGYFAGELTRAALVPQVEFAIGARRIAPLWRILDGIAATAWTDAIDMTRPQVAIAGYCPDWWPAATRLLIRRVALDITAGHVKINKTLIAESDLRRAQRIPPRCPRSGARPPRSVIVDHRDVVMALGPIEAAPHPHPCLPFYALTWTTSRWTARGADTTAPPS
jgi:hypothetical protein